SRHITATPTGRGRPPYCTTTIAVQYTMPSDASAPVRYPRRKPCPGLRASASAISSGVSATQATRPWPNFGNESARRTAERAARPSLRPGRTGRIGDRRPRRDEAVEDLLGVEGGAHEHAGVHGREAQRARLVAPALELV